jgi:hypothetical protein
MFFAAVNHIFFAVEAEIRRQPVGRGGFFGRGFGGSLAGIGVGGGASLFSEPQPAKESAKKRD